LKREYTKAINIGDVGDGNLGIVYIISG